MSDANNNLGELIESTRKDAQEQQARADAQVNAAATPPRGKQILTALLLAVFSVVLWYQYPRFSQPFTWPDPATSSSAAEGELLEMVGLIEIYRMAQGQYPAVLSQLALPPGLAERVSSAVLLYRPTDKSYTLDWTLPHWRASYDSETEKVSIAPLGKP